MNGVAHRPRRNMAQTVFIAAAIAIAVLFFVFPKEAARGWLIAFSDFQPDRAGQPGAALDP